MRKENLNKCVDGLVRLGEHITRVKELRNRPPVDGFPLKAVVDPLIAAVDEILFLILNMIADEINEKL